MTRERQRRPRDPQCTVQTDESHIACLSLLRSPEAAHVPMTHTSVPRYASGGRWGWPVPPRGMTPALLRKRRFCSHAYRAAVWCSRQNFRYVCGLISRSGRLIVTPTTMVVAVSRPGAQRRIQATSPVGACEALWGWGAMGRKSSNTYQHPSRRPAVTRSTSASPEFILLTITTSPGWSGAARLLSSKRTHRAWWRAPFVPATTTSGSSTVIMVRRSSFA
jgi:hypothetical protein